MTPATRGRLIALEGIDGCGKSTQARLLADDLGAVLTREPGGTALGKALRALLLDAEGVATGARAEALLMVADRAQHVDEVIRPAIEAGRWVVTDRFSGSTLAYQGWGRGLDLGALETMLAWATDGITPDLSVLLDVDVDVARERMGQSAADRLESLGADFFGRVRDGFRSLAAADRTRWVVVDGSADVTAVAAAVAEAVARRLGRRGQVGKTGAVRRKAPSGDTLGSPRIGRDGKPRP